MLVVCGAIGLARIEPKEDMAATAAAAVAAGVVDEDTDETAGIEVEGVLIFCETGAGKEAFKIGGVDEMVLGDAAGADESEEAIAASEDKPSKRMVGDDGVVEGTCMGSKGADGKPGVEPRAVVDGTAAVADELGREGIKGAVAGDEAWNVGINGMETDIGI